MVQLGSSINKAHLEGPQTWHLCVPISAESGSVCTNTSQWAQLQDHSSPSPSSHGNQWMLKTSPIQPASSPVLVRLAGCFSLAGMTSANSYSTYLWPWFSHALVVAVTYPSFVHSSHSSHQWVRQWPDPSQLAPSFSFCVCWRVL